MQYTLERDSEELELEVEYEYHKAHRGYRNSMGVPEEPDDPEEIEVTSVTDESGKEVKLSDSEQEALEAACWADLEGRRTDALIDRYEE